MHIFTVDFECPSDYYTDKQGNRREISQEGFFRSCEKLFSLLEQHKVKPTFFIMGKVADRYPDMIAEIAKKYDIGSHGYAHLNADKFSLGEFEKDLQKSLDVLEKVTGKRPDKFRCPYFSLPDKRYLAVLAANGIKTDCSLASLKHAYGPKVIESDTPCRLSIDQSCIRELPPSNIGFGSLKFGFLGGGYFRFFPYFMLRYWTKQKRDYSVSYIHPLDLCVEKPKDHSKTFVENFRARAGLGRAASKLDKYLSEFDFIDVETATKTIDWEHTPILKF